MIKTSKVHSRFVPSVGDNKQYTFVFTIDENGKTTALHCDERNISNTFKCSQRFQFADKKEVNSALASYYGTSYEKYKSRWYRCCRCHNLYRRGTGGTSVLITKSQNKIYLKKINI